MDTPETPIQTAVYTRLRGILRNDNLSDDEKFTEISSRVLTLVAVQTTLDALDGLQAFVNENSTDIAAMLKQAEPALYGDQVAHIENASENVNDWDQPLPFDERGPLDDTDDDA
jgi:hypothetical protein